MKATHLAIAGFLAAIVVVEKPARACGGMFCDRGTPTVPPMPVDQKGENILFVLDGKTVEAHVQIQYKGEPSRFAWIVPMPAAPTVTVGSEQLFTNLLQGTVPRYGYQIAQDSCPCYTCQTPSFAAGTGGAAASRPIGADAGTGVTVLFQKSVGAFEVTALQGHSATEVVDWLSANGYQSISTAPAILDRYVQKGSVFVAVKLTAGAGSDQIHPLVFKYTGTEPCIPLELTSVAAVEDMGVRAFFLGTDRVVSTNYDHVTLNPSRIDWSTMGQNYNDVVSQAVDEAGGHTFVTEYAGTSSIVNKVAVDPRWDESAFAGLGASDVVSELSAQGLMSCYTPVGLPSTDAGPGSCTANHPLILPLLHEFLPPPQGVSDGAFYSCVTCYSPDAGAFDSAKFGAALRDRVFEPARHATAILSRWLFLTRLFTTISPSEMNLDPLFEARKAEAGISLPGQAIWRRTMTSATGFTLPGGQMVALDGSLWPAFTSAMPWTARIDRYPAGKPVKLVTDNTSTIQSELDKWNQSKSWPLPAPNCPGPPAGTGGGGSGQGGFGGTFAIPPGTGGTSGSGLGKSTGADAGSGVRAQSSDSGCTFSHRSSRGPGALSLAVVGALAVVARRRRQRMLSTRS